jgi:hypothetical protein
MWRRRRTKPPRRQQALGLLQDAMRRVEQDRDAADPAPTVVAGVVLDRSDAPLPDALLPDAVPPQAGQAQVPPRQKVPPQVRSQPAQPRETSTTGTGGAGW